MTSQKCHLKDAPKGFYEANSAARCLKRKNIKIIGTNNTDRCLKEVPRFTSTKALNAIKPKVNIIERIIVGSCNTLDRLNLKN